MAASIAILRWIKPDEMGLWQSMLIVQTYTSVMQAGMITGLSRELPFLLGAGKTDQVRRLASTALAFALLGCAILLLAITFIPVLTSNRNLYLSWIVVFSTSSAIVYESYLGATFRANMEFDKLSAILIIESILAVVTLLLVKSIGYDGMVYRYALIVIFGTAIRHAVRPIRVLPKFDKESMMLLMKVGMPIFIFGYLIQTMYTYPRLILLKESGVMLVGLYAPASAVIGLMRMIPKSIASYLFPQMSFKLGKAGDPRVLWPMAWKSSMYFLLMGIPVLIIGSLLIDPIIRNYFPNYIGSVEAARWSMVTGLFLGSQITLNAMFSLKAWRWLSVYVSLTLCLTSIFSLVLSMVYEPLLGVSMGFAIAQGLSFIICLMCTKRAIDESYATGEFSLVNEAS
jgi:O-antigen/teichoic acid export membrane protein